jgi:hypothetical protein
MDAGSDSSAADASVDRSDATIDLDAGGILCGTMICMPKYTCQCQGTICCPPGALCRCPPLP